MDTKKARVTRQEPSWLAVCAGDAMSHLVDEAFTELRASWTTNLFAANAHDLKCIAEAINSAPRRN